MEDKLSYKLESVKYPDGECDTLVEYLEKEGQEPVGEALITVNEVKELMQTCQERWKEYGWDMAKLLTCVRESEID